MFMEMPWLLLDFSITSEGGRLVNHASKGQCGLAAIFLPRASSVGVQLFDFAGVVLDGDRAIACRKGILSLRDFNEVPSVLTYMSDNSLPLMASDAGPNVKPDESSAEGSGDHVLGICSAFVLAAALLFTWFSVKKENADEGPICN